MTMALDREHPDSHTAHGDGQYGTEDVKTAANPGLQATLGNWVAGDAKETASWNLGDFENLSQCCKDALEAATENLAFIAGDLLSKAEATLDEAAAAIRAGGADSLAKADRLITVAAGYRTLAEAVA